MADENTAPTVRDIITEQVDALREASTENVTTVDQEESNESRTRDEKGRFASKGEPETPITPAPATPSATQTPEAPVTPELSALPRPSSWKKEMWPVWDKLSTGAQLTPQEARQVAEYNAQREQQFAVGVSTYKQEAERNKPILEAIAPFQQDIERVGIPMPQMVHNLLNAHRTLAMGAPAQKLQFLAQLARDYGIPLNAFFDQNVHQQYLNSAPPQPQFQAPPQPQVDINQKIEEVIQQREVQQTVAKMESNTDQYPFFPYVRGTMAQLLESGEATDLDDAYQKALDRPEHALLSGALQQQQLHTQQAAEAEARQKAARAARANAISPKSSTPMAATPNGKTSVRDAILNAVEQHRGATRV